MSQTNQCSEFSVQAGQEIRDQGSFPKHLFEST